jgi:hypothetical protein
MRQVVNSFYFSFDISLIAILNVSGLVLVFVYMIFKKLSYKNWAFFFLIPGFPEDGKVRIPVFFFWYVPLFTKEEWNSITSEKILEICRQYWITYHPHLLDLILRTGQYLCLLNDGKFVVWKGSYMGINIEIYFSVEILKYGLTIEIWC